jgi:tRNA pseudouridine55 synthase
MSRRKKGNPVHGWAVLDKPLGMTSTQAVGAVRRLFAAQKAGNAGTLDPLATGILPIALGEATKTVPFAVDGEKAYRFSVRFGIETDTDDAEGKVVRTAERLPSAEDIADVLADFTGEISQVPPAFSAIKVDGERAYDLARAGEAFELAARAVVVHAARVSAAPDADHVEIELECGKGTYVRSIVRDLAAALGAEAHVSALRRTRVGPFGEDRAILLENLEDMSHKAALPEVLLPVETALDDIPVLAVTDEDAFRLKQGRSIVLVPRQVEAVKAGLRPGSRTVSAMAGGMMVALCEMRAGRLEPSRVFNF